MNKNILAIVDRFASSTLSSEERLIFLAQSFLLIKQNEVSELKSLLADDEITAKYEQMKSAYEKQNVSVRFIDKVKKDSFLGAVLLDLLNLFEANVINFSDMADAVSQINSASGGNDIAVIKVPDELYKLGVAALGGKTDSVYCPFDLSYPFAEELAESGDVAYEARNALSFFVVDVRSQLLDCRYERQLSDPIRQPSFIVSGGLKAFTSAVAFPPIGTKYQSPDELNDIWYRFPEKSFTGDVFHLRHMLSQATDRVVAFVAAGFLSRATAGERKFKQSILKSNWLESVISLPSGILMPSTSVNLSMIVLDKQRTSRYVKFIDASSNFEKKSAKEIRLIGIDDIANLLDAEASKSKVTLVTSQEIEANEYDLSVPRYVISQEDQALYNELEQYELTDLENVVELIRPQAAKSVEGGEYELVEINISSFNKIGEYNGIHKVIYQENDPSNKSSRASRRFIEENDVLIASKGSIGRIGLVEKLPAELTIAGQSFMIARVSPNEKGISATWLYQFLSSKLGYEQLQRIQSGAVIPFINIKDLKRLRIPLASQEQLEAAEKLRAEVKERHRKIEELQASLDQLTQDRWF